jgi:hypothetical protein
MTTPDPDMILCWLDKFGNDYEVLKFILTNRNHGQTWVVLNVLPSSLVSSSLSLIDEDNSPGEDFEIYSEILRSSPYQVPEIKAYPDAIRRRFRSDICWVRWAGIFDRQLTIEQRKILIHYRTAFLCLLVNGFSEEAEHILKMAEYPQTCEEERITGEFLYSREVLRGTLRREN